MDRRPAAAPPPAQSAPGKGQGDASYTLLSDVRPMAHVPKASGVPILPNFQPGKPGGGGAARSASTSLIHSGGAQLMTRPTHESQVPRASVDPFSTPARRRRIVGDVAMFLVKQYYAKACKGVEQYRRYTTAAITVQCAFRCMSSRFKLKHLRWLLHTWAAIVLQKHARRLAAENLLVELRREALRLKRRNSAIRIQCRVRQRIASRLVERLRHIRRTKAAVTIQRMFRGAVGRRLYLAVLKAHRAHLLKINRTATKIQCAWRRYRAIKLLFYLRMKRKITRSVLSWWRSLVLKRAVATLVHDGQRFARGMLARLRYRELQRLHQEKLGAEERRRQAECLLMRQEDRDVPSSVTVVELKALLPPRLVRHLLSGGPPSVAEWCIKQGILALDETEASDSNTLFSFTTGSLIQSIFGSVNDLEQYPCQQPGSLISLQHPRSSKRLSGVSIDELPAILSKFNRLRNGWGQSVQFSAPGTLSRLSQLPCEGKCNHSHLPRLRSCIKCRPVLINELIRKNQYVRNKLVFLESKGVHDSNMNGITVTLATFSVASEHGAPGVVEKRVILKFDADGTVECQGAPTQAAENEDDISALNFQFNNSVIKVTMWDRAPMQVSQPAAVVESFGVIEDAIEERIMPVAPPYSDSGAHGTSDPGRVVHVLLIEEEEEDLIPYDDMASIIQCVVRVRQAKARCAHMRFLRSKRLFIHTFLKRSIIMHAWHSAVWRIIEKMHESAVYIQRIYRGRRGKRRFLDRARAVNVEVMGSLVDNIELQCFSISQFNSLKFPLSNACVDKCAAELNLDARFYSVSLDDHQSLHVDTSAHIDKFLGRIPSLGWASDLHSVLGAPQVPPGCVDPDHLYVCALAGTSNTDASSFKSDIRDDEAEFFALLRCSRTPSEAHGSPALDGWILQPKSGFQTKYDQTLAKRLVQGRLKNSKSGTNSNRVVGSEAPQKAKEPDSRNTKLDSRPRSISESAPSGQPQLRKAASMSTATGGKSMLPPKKAAKDRNVSEEVSTGAPRDEESEHTSMPTTRIADEAESSVYAPSFGNIILPSFSFSTSHRNFGLKHFASVRRTAPTAADSNETAAGTRISSSS